MGGMLKRPVRWFALTLTGWPLVYLLLALIRDGALSGAELRSAAAFLGMGAVSGAALVWLMHRSANETTRISVLIGYLVLCPFAFAGGLFSGLALGVPLLGTAVYGGLPLVVGSLLGYFIGYRVTE